MPAGQLGRAKGKMAFLCAITDQLTGIFKQAFRRNGEMLGFHDDEVLVGIFQALKRGWVRNTQDGHMILTTHRLVWIDAAAAPAAGGTCALPLSTVREVRLKATHLWSSTKVRISVHVDENRRPTGKPRDHANALTSHVLRLSS
jgi:hypothetical protein